MERMYRIFIYAIAALFLLANAESFAQHGLFWSGRPNVNASISSIGSWQNIDGSLFHISLDSSKFALVSYDVQLEGLKGTEGTVLPKDSNFDIIQLRCVIDDVAYRSSSSYGFSYLVTEVTPVTLASSFAVELPAGNHSITLQWKKTGVGIEKWVFASSSSNAGLAISVQADHSQIWYKSEMNDKFISSNSQWQSLSSAIEFSVPTEQQVTIGYTVIVQPQLGALIKDRNVEFLTIRISLDGIPYIEGSESHGCNSWDPSVGTLKGFLTVTVSAGQHYASLQWKKAGITFRTWASSPSYLDGFASSRNLYVLLESDLSPTLIDYQREVLRPLSKISSWSNVGDNALTFNLPRESAVLITYSLPLTQYGNPLYDANIWKPEAQLSVRLLVDNIPYTYVGSVVSSSTRYIDSTFGNLALLMAAGSHTITLQWKYQGSDWITLNDINGGFAHGEKLLSFVSSANIQISIDYPTSLTTYEDIPIDFACKLGGVDSKLLTGIYVFVNITVLNEFVVVESVPFFTSIEYIYASNYTTILLSDNMANVNQALSSLRYFTREYWNGQDEIFLSVYTGENNIDPTASQIIYVTVLPVDNQFSVDLVAVNTVDGVHSTLLKPILLNDVDSENSTFRAQLFVTCGQLTLLSPNSSSLLFFVGNGNLNSALDFQGSYYVVQTILKSIHYTPTPSCQNAVHGTILSVKIINTANLAQNVTKIGVLNILPVNYPPHIEVPMYPRWRLSGIQVNNGDNETIEYTQYPVYETSSLRIVNGQSLAPDNKNAAASMSELSLYRTLNADFALFVQYHSSTIRLISSNYLQSGFNKSILIFADFLNGSNVHQDVFCVVENANFIAVILNNSILLCNVSYSLRDPQSLNPYYTAWLHVYVPTSGIRSNYLPLFVAPALAISDVWPLRHFPSGQAVVSYAVNLPGVATNCFFRIENSTEPLVTSVVEAGAVSYCRAPVFNRSGNSQFYVGSVDQYFVSESVPMTILLPLRANSSSANVVDSGELLINLFGDFSTQFADFPSVICHIQNISVEAAFLSDSSITCVVSAFDLGNTICALSTINVSFSVFSDISEKVVVDISNLTAFFPNCKHPYLTSSSLPNSSVQLSTDASPKITIDRISPLVVTSLGGTDISIFGGPFYSNSTLSCVFSSSNNSTANGDIIPALFVSEDVIICTTTPHSISVVRVSVLVDDFLYTSTSNLRYVSWPTVYSGFPLVSLGGGGAMLSVAGVGFIEMFDDSPYSNFKIFCRFGSSIVIEADDYSDSSVYCTIPSWQQDEVIEVTVLITAYQSTDVASLTTVQAVGSVQFQYISPIGLLSINPSKIRSSGGVIVTLNGLYFPLSASSACIFNDISSPALFLDNTTIECLAPKATPDSNVVVVHFAVDGVVLDVNGVELSYFKTVHLNSLSPSSGPVNGATNVTVLGSGFDLESDNFCAFGSILVRALYLNENQVTCASPASYFAGTVTFSLVVNDETISSASNPCNFTYTVPLTITSIAPNIGFVTGLTVVSVNGSGFRNNLQPTSSISCYFGNIKVAAMVTTDSSLTCVSPVVRRVQSVNFFVTDLLNGKSNVLTYRYVDTPVITGIVPGRGDAKGGNTVKISGVNFFFSDDIQCIFGSISSQSARVTDEFSLECVVPSFYSVDNTTITEPVAIQVGIIIAGSAIQTAGILYTFMPSLVIESVQPTHGTIAGGTNVVVSGYNFPVAESLFCMFGHFSSVRAQFISQTEVICISDAQSNGTVEFKLVTSYSSADSIIGPIFYSFSSPPKVISISPTRGVVGVGLNVTIFGSDFLEYSRLFNVQYFCQFSSIQSLIPAMVVSDSNLTCSLPLTTYIGAVTVSVFSDEFGNEQLEGSATFNIIEPLFIKSVFPNYGTVDGGERIVVDIADLNTPKLQLDCSFGPFVSPSIALSDGSIECVVPPSGKSGTVPFSLFVGGFIVSANKDIVFTYIPAAKILNVFPTSGLSAGGTVVTVSGSNYSNSMEINCKFGDSILSEALFVNESSLQCVSPSHAQGKVNFSLVIDGTEIYTPLSFTFQFTSAILLVSIFPNGGPVSGGTTVTVGSDLPLHGLGNIECLFGNTTVPAALSASNLLQCVSPGASSADLVPFAIVRNGDKSVGDFHFRYFGEPKLVSISPEVGDVIGGTLITVHGVHFPLDAENVTCKFGMDEHSVLGQIVSPTVASCYSPAVMESMTVPLILIVDGYELNEVGVKFSFTSTPILTDIQPKWGFTGIPFNFSVVGTNFYPAESVTCVFRDSSSIVGALPGVFISENLIVCTSLSYLEGMLFISVQLDGVSASSAANVTIYIIPIPAILSIEPSIGITSHRANVSLIGEGFFLKGFVSSAFIECKIGNSYSTAIVTSDSSISCVAENSDVGVVDVYITINRTFQAVGSALFRFNDQMLLTSIEPSSGVGNGGSTVTIYGEGFIAVENIVCRFGEYSTPAIVVSTQVIECLTPQIGFHGIKSEVNVAVGIAEGDILSNFVSFEFLPSFVLSRIFPSEGSSLGGTVISVIGYEFTFANKIFCSFGEVITTAAFISETEVQCITMPHSPGTVNFSLIIDDFRVYSIANSNVFSFVPPLAESNISGTIKSTASVWEMEPSLIFGYSTIRFTGANFSINSLLTCNFGNRSHSPITFLSDSILTCNLQSSITNVSSILVALEDESGSVLFEKEAVFAPEPQILDVWRYFDWAVGIQLTSVQDLKNLVWVCLYNGVEYSSYELLNETVLCIAPVNNSTANLFQICSKDASFCTEEFNFTDLNAFAIGRDEETPLLSDIPDDIILCNQFSTLLSFRAAKNLDCRNFIYTPTQVQPSTIVRKYQTYNSTNNSEDVSHSFDIAIMKPRLYSKVISIDDSLAHCAVSAGQNGCFDDSWLMNVSAIAPISNSTASTTNNSSRYAFLVIESILPNIIDAENGTWVAIQGRTYSAKTTCALSSPEAENFSLPLETVFLSTSYLRCFIPGYAVVNSLEISISLSEEDAIIVSSDLSDTLLMYDVFESPYVRYTGSINSTDVTTKNSSSDSANLKGIELRSKLCEIGEQCSPFESSTPPSEIFCPNSNTTYSLKNGFSVLSVENVTTNFTNTIICNYFDFLASNSSGGITVNITNTDYLVVDNLPRVIWSSPAEIDLMKDSTDITFIIDSPNVTQSSTWCLLLEDANFVQTQPCFPDGYFVYCTIPSVNITSFHLNGNLLLNCLPNSSIYESIYSVLFGDNNINWNRSNYSDSLQQNALKKDVIAARITPFLGSHEGNTTITIYGKNLYSVQYCSFRLGADESVFTVSYFSREEDGSAISFITPSVSVISSASIVLVLKDGSSSSTNLNFRFVAQPEINYASFLDNSNGSLSIFGSNFPIYSAPICKLSFSDIEDTFVPGYRISDQEIQCANIDMIVVNIYAVTRISISINGQDFVGVNFSSSIVSNTSVALIVAATPTPRRSIQSSLYNPYVDSLALLCDDYFEVPIYIPRVEQFVKYQCLLNGILGTARYINANQLACAFTSQSPGTYSLEIVDPSTNSFFSPIRFSIRCLVRPKIISLYVEAQPALKTSTSSIVISGLNFDKSLPFLVSIGSSEGQTLFNSVKQLVASLSSLRSGFQTITLSANRKTIFSSVSYISPHTIKHGGYLLPNDTTNATNVESERNLNTLSVTTQIPKYDRPISTKIVSITPRSGLSFGNTAVSVVASGVQRNDRVLCLFGNRSIAADIVDYGRVVCHTPSSEPGNVSVSLRSISTGNIWCCQHFVFHPVIQLRNATPDVLDSRGGTVVVLNTNSFVYFNVSLFCYFNSNQVAVYQIGPKTLTCVAPELLTHSMIEVSIGSIDEIWTNTIPMYVSSLPSEFSIVPTHGTIYGGTTISVVYPSLNIFKSPICSFGNGVKSPLVKRINNYTIACVTPSFPILGEIDVNILDSADENSPVFLAGSYRFELPATVYRIMPSSVLEGKQTLLQIFGTNFVDSSSLACFFGPVQVQARWLSSILLTCTIPVGSTLTDRTAVAVRVSNNGLDTLSAVNLTINSVNKIRRTSTLQGFVSGGSTVEFSFAGDYYSPITCIFGASITVAAYSVGSKDYVCVSPPFYAGNTSFSIVDISSTELFNAVYSYVDLPSLLMEERPIVLAGVQESFEIVGTSFSPYVAARFHDVSGNISPGYCKAINNTSLFCSVTADGNEEFLFIDLTVNGIDFLQRFCTIQVFKPSSVAIVDPLYLLSEGGQKISFVVDRFMSSFSTYCVFQFGNGELKSIVDILSDIKGECAVPALPLQGTISFAIVQKGATIFGPSDAIVMESITIADYEPKMVVAGTTSTLYISFARAINLFPPKICSLDGVSANLELVNSTFGFCLLQPLKFGLFNFSVGFSDTDYGSVQLGDLEVISSESAHRNSFSVSDDSVVLNAVQNISISSATCSFPLNSYCTVDGINKLPSSAQTTCLISCSVFATQNTKVLKLSVCSSVPCSFPIFSTTLNILSPVSIVLISPPSGSATGGQRVSIFGSGFENDATLQCMFGSIPVPAIVRDSYTIFCESPPYQQLGQVNVSIFRAGKLVSTSIAVFDYFFALLTGVTVIPTTLSSAGGTNLLISTPFFNETGPLYCRFTYKYVPAVIINATRFNCESPPLDIQQTSFALSLNGADVSVPVNLSVVSPVTVLFVNPTAVDNQQPFNISIYLAESIEMGNRDIICTLDNLVLTTIFSEGANVLSCMNVNGSSSGYHNLKLSLGSSVIFDTQIMVRGSFQIMKVSPLFGFSRSATTITITVNQVNSGSEYSKCCFQLDDVTLYSAAMLLSSNLWQCSTPLFEHPIGQSSVSLPIGLAKAAGFCEYSGLNFTSFYYSEALSLSPTSGVNVGGTVITVSFAKNISVNILYCRLGLQVTTGQVINGNQLLCVTQRSSIGSFVLEVSPNKLSFTSTRLMFTFLPLLPTTASVFSSESNTQISSNGTTSSNYLDQLLGGNLSTGGSSGSSSSSVTLINLTPQSFPSGGQFTVTVGGVGFQKGSICVIGNNSYPLSSTVVSDVEMNCVLPLHPPGTDIIAVQNFDGTQSTNSLQVTFVPDPTVYSTLPQPSFGSLTVQTTIQVFGNRLDTVDANLYCYIDQQWSFATNITGSSVSCLTPVVSSSGKVKVQLSVNKQNFISGYTYFEYIRDPAIFTATPLLGAPNSPIVISGIGFSRLPAVSCAFGDQTVPATVLSDSKISCYPPVLSQNVVGRNLQQSNTTSSLTTALSFPLTLQTNGQHVLSSGVIFTYLPSIVINYLTPVVGPALRGGTLISIFGSGFENVNTVDLQCIFGTSKVSAIVLSDSVIQCRTPPHRLGLVNVSVVNDGRLLSTQDAYLNFLYTADVSVDKISPSFGYTSGEFPVFVFGSNFLNTTSLGCRFADMNSRGIFLNNNSIICLAPSPLGRPELHSLLNVPVEVTVNGLDYSQSGVEFKYTQPCDLGFFCPGMTRQLCPNGTYCPINSLNFTLCEPGTFQPKEGQSGCLLCPVGYICPDFGMSRPVNCPAGFVCDVMGLRSSVKLCPLGCYCLNGTKADNVNLFAGNSTAWIEDYVTGVYTFNVSSYGSIWDYVDWPAPAVGRSRALHPPSQQCDGLVCAGGSQNVLAEGPFPCPIGHYCRAGVTTQIPAVKNFSTPQRCFDGFFCPRGSVSPEGSGPCPNGYFCPTQLDAMECPEGHYCPGVGNRAPLECYPGTFNPFTGRANCTVCPSGFICPGWGTLLPEPCPAGFVCTSLGLSYPVVMCPQGYYCVEGTKTADPSSTIQQKPVICKEGEFCLGGVFEDLNVEWIPSQSYGSAFSQRCSEGTYCQAGAYLSSGTGLCYFGHYCPPATSFPKETPVGNFASGEGSVAPTLCYPGTYAPLIAQVNCQICPSGHTCISYGTYIPTICLQGTYRMQVDSVSCNSCPTGTYSNEVGAVDITQCFSCPPRRVCATTKMFNLTSSSDCPAGYVCGYGTDLSTQFSHLTPAGFFSNADTLPTEIYTGICEPGYYCPRGTPASSKEFGKCPVGSYCPAGTPAVVMSETLCPPLTTSISGVTTITNCVIAPVDVCDKIDTKITDPMTDIAYLSSFSYNDLYTSSTQYTFDSSLTSVNPTGEIQVVDRINPINYTASSPVWVNETIEAFRACPLYGSGAGGDVITIIGRNFIDKKLNYCKFRACYSSNLGEHPRRCKNQVNDQLGNALSVAGNVSESAYITRAKYISPTRMECTVPEFLFAEEFNPDPLVAFYQCKYINSTNQITKAGFGNLSYVRQCSPTALYKCPNVPGPNQEYFPQVTFPCTAEEILNLTCAHNPEPNYMFNPCMTSEVLVEVTNDGEHYSGGNYLGGVSIISTVRYGDGRKIYNNFKNTTTPATFAVYTYVQPNYFYTNPEIMLMERRYCRIPRFSEEGQRNREQSWFQLNLNEAAHVHVNFSFVPSNLVYNQHYRLAIYIIPSRCTIELCDSSRNRLSPQEFIPCRKPAEFSGWFTDTSNPKNVKNNITVYALDDLIFKVEVQILHGLFDMYKTLFENCTIVRIASPSRALSFTGLPMELVETRTLSPYVSFEERRVPMQYFFCAVVYQSDSGSVNTPLNLPPLYADYQTGRALLMYNVSAGNTQVAFINDGNSNSNFWGMPALTSDESKEILDAYFETFQDTTYDPINGYVFNFDTLLIPYLPYFSSCNTFDSYVPIWLVTEGQECALPDYYNKTWYRYKYPALPDQDHIKFTGPFDFFGNPTADWCYRTLSCNYEEAITTSGGTPRWFEQSTGNTLFHLLRYPVNYTFYTGRPGGTHISTQDAGGGNAVLTYALISQDNFIPVIVDHTLGDAIQGCSGGCVARAYLFTIKYYQVDNFTKKIVAMTLKGSQYDMNAKNTAYTLTINYYALGFYDLLLNFAYTPIIFLVIFLFLGVLTVAISVIGWGIARITTLLQNPPGVKLFSMLNLTEPPAISGTYMAVIPIWIMTSLGNYLINGFFYTNPNTPVVLANGLAILDTEDLTYNLIGTAVTAAQYTAIRAGRIGTVFCIVGIMSWIIATRLFFPKKETKKEREIAKMRTYLAEKEEIWKVVLWKKANFVWVTLVVTIISTLLIEVSYWSLFGPNIYIVIIMMVIIGTYINNGVQYLLQDAILVSPVSAGFTFATALVTFGAPDFLTFLLSYFLGVAQSQLSRVFQNYYVDIFSDIIASMYELSIRLSLRFIPRYMSGAPAAKKSDDIVQDDKVTRKREVDDVQDNGASHESVEPIIDYFNGVCGDSMTMYYFPYFVYLLMQYRLEIVLPVSYGIRQSDMLIYMIFQLIMCLFEPIADAFNHFENEQFFGWKIYEYLVYCRYRFLQREARWKGMEHTLDECIDEDMRTLDQMCFSSQFYLMMSFHFSGMVYVMLAFQCWLRNSAYNPFSDPALFIILIYLLVCYYVLEWVIYYLAVWLKVWKIKHENTAWHIIKKEEDEWDLPGWEDVKGASTEAFLMNQRITSETFRYKFLNYNRTWLINQLPQLLTPRTMRRSRPYLINQFARIINARRDDISDDSDKDKDKKFGPVSLTAPSRNIIRWWLGKARRRIRLRNIVDPLIKRARGAQCEQCLSRKQLQIEYEVDIDKMAEMYDRAYPGDEEVDQVQWKSFWMNNQRYHTICLACLTKRKEAAARAAVQSSVLGFDPSIFDDGQEDYPDWGPVYLTAASKAMLLNWYRKAQLLRAGKKGRRREKVLKAISDDEEDDLPFSWLKEMPNITPSTNAIAVKWMRSARARLQKKRGKGTSIRESDVAAEVEAPETFKSGKKSKMAKK